LLLLTAALTFPLTTPVFAQDAPAMDKMSAEGRWEGHIIRSSKDKSTLTVRKAGTSEEKNRPVRQFDTMGKSETRRQERH